jgi:thiamine-phosphate pyrophosphorylase
MTPAAARLYLLFTPGLCTGAPWATLAAALDGGVDMVQWRVARPARRGLARCLAICGERSVPVIVNDDVALAVAAGAAGAHVGQADVPARAARAQLRAGQVLGVSTHDVAQVRAAQDDGADYLGFGPCFPTATKGYAAGVGAAAIRAAVAAARVPVFAIGGIAPANVGELLALGVTRVAVSGAVLRAADPRAAAAALRAGLAAP